MEIKYCEGKLGENIGQLINDGFTKYAEKSGISTNYKEFNFVVYESGEVAGILEGITLYDEVRISNLIVDEKYRKKGIGSRLLNSVFERFDSKVFKCVSLCTFDFQAPKFYEKCGFELEFVRENKKNPKLTKYFFIKYL